MVWKDAVVTMAGVSLLKEALSGQTLHITGAAGGTGTVDSAALITQTALVDSRQTLSLVGAQDTANGKRLKIQITSQGLSVGYKLTQLGIWAELNTDTPVLFAILQDGEGVNIPSAAELPEFLLEFYALIEFSQSADIVITLDTSASVSSATLEEKLAAKEGLITAAPEKASVQDTDTLVLSDDGTTQRVTVGNMKVALKGYFDTIYETPAGAQAKADAVLQTARKEMEGKADLSNGKVPDSQLPGYIPSGSKGASGGVAELDSSGRVPAAQLPSYVDDVLEYAGLSAFPKPGENGKIYVDTATNLTYRWSGSAYVEISPSLALGETASTAYRGDRGKAAYDHISDGVKHITAAERTAWNAKETPAGAQQKADEALQTARSEISALDTKKVDKVSGKGLSTNDYTTAEKEKLAGIAEGANKTVVDAALSSTSENPAQNKAVNAGIEAVQANLNSHTGNKSNPHGVTAEQVGAAPASHTHADKLSLSGGTMTGVLTAKNSADGATAQVRNIIVSTVDLEAGVSPLEDGVLYLVYEE